MQELLTILRNKKTKIDEFRKAAEGVSKILAKDIFDIQQIKNPEGNFVLVPVLRSGMVLLPAFMEMFTTAKVGFIGLKRNEKTLKPKAYYHNLPKIKSKDKIIVLDPMLATGGSAVATIKDLIEAGAKEDNITFVCIISAPEGIAKLQKTFPNISLMTGVQDKKLDKTGYIVPGLGDFGDRYFGTVK